MLFAVTVAAAVSAAAAADDDDDDDDAVRVAVSGLKMLFAVTVEADVSAVAAVVVSVAVSGLTVCCCSLKDARFCRFGEVMLQRE